MLSGGGNGRGGCHVGIKALSAEVGIILCRGDSLSGCLSLGILLGGEHEVHVELLQRFDICLVFITTKDTNITWISQRNTN
jgi:hypothetical protein